jgi:hypothetical protein
LFVTPPEVRRSFKLPPGFIDVGEYVLALRDAYALETGKPAKTHRFPPPQGQSRTLAKTTLTSLGG